MSVYAGRRVLVLGGLGFIGRHVTCRLRELGAAVTATTRTLAAHAEDAAELEADGVRVVEADIRDASAMRDAVRGQETIFNLAGQSGAVASMEDPLADLDVNCRGNLVLLEAVRAENPAARLVLVSSRLAYGRAAAQPVVEEQRPEPLCVHAVHRLATEQYLRIYGAVYGISWTAARLTNPYGTGQPIGRTSYGVVNRMIHLAIAGATLHIYGDGRQQRDYIYIDDAVEALLRMGEAPRAAGRVYNVGSGIGTPLVDMAGAICRIAGAGRIEFAPWPEMAARIETGDFVAAVDRIRRDLEWEPRVSLTEGLTRTVAHYKSHVASLK